MSDDIDKARAARAQRAIEVMIRSLTRAA